MLSQMSACAPKFDSYVSPSNPNHLTRTQISGHILVDGKAREEGFSAKIGYVEQDDQLMGVMTVRENLLFSAELRLPVSISKNEKRCRVEDTIELLGLWKCANSKIGTQMIRVRTFEGGKEGRREGRWG